LQRNFPGVFAGEIPEGYKELREKFKEILEEATDINKKSRLLILIDAINQFDDNYNVSSMDWIPEILLMGLKIVVSTLKV
jgi:hypothetical protein